MERRRRWEIDRRTAGVMLTAFGLVVTVAVGLVVYVQTSEVETLREALPRRWAVVAAVDIPERTVITADQVTFIRAPDSVISLGAAIYVPGGEATGEQVEAGKRAALAKVVDQFTPQPIYRGEVINTQRLGRQGAKGSPAYEIPPGKVWYHFPVKLSGGNPPNERMLIAFLDLVRAGDHIDIYYTTIEAPTAPSLGVPAPTDELRGLHTRRIMQNVKVINVGLFPIGTATAREDRYLTLEVTADQALILKWLKDAATITGNMEFILRSPLDTQVLPATTIDYSLISREYGIGTGR